MRHYLSDHELRFLLPDEVNFVLTWGFLDTAEVFSGLQDRRPAFHLVVAGRGTPHALLEAADLVTEMRDVTRPFRVGIPDHPGIEL